MGFLPSKRLPLPGRNAQAPAPKNKKVFIEEEEEAEEATGAGHRWQGALWEEGSIGSRRPVGPVGALLPSGDPVSKPRPALPETQPQNLFSRAAEGAGEDADGAEDEAPVPGANAKKRQRSGQGRAARQEEEVRPVVLLRAASTAVEERLVKPHLSGCGHQCMLQEAEEAAPGSAEAGAEDAAAGGDEQEQAPPARKARAGKKEKAPSKSRRQQ